MDMCKHSTIKFICEYFVDVAFKRLKGSQRQWYEFDEASMTIRVFRTEEEANTVNKEPLRVINVLNAVFNIDPSELNQFVIT
ncbi:unnamed protein product [Dicrocoelium dendriticum]|nr:unnamed protein product [Dicrocoelium dendriticum]